MELKALLEASRRHVGILGLFAHEEGNDLVAVTPEDALRNMRFQLVSERRPYEVNAEHVFWSYEVRSPRAEQERRRKNAQDGQGAIERGTIDASQGPIGEYLGSSELTMGAVGARVLSDLMDAIETEAMFCHQNFAIQLTEAVYHVLCEVSDPFPGEERLNSLLVRRVLYDEEANAAILSYLCASAAQLGEGPNLLRDRLTNACRHAFGRENKPRGKKAGANVARVVRELRSWLAGESFENDPGQRFSSLEPATGTSAEAARQSAVFERVRNRYAVPGHGDANLRELYQVYRASHDRVESIAHCEPVMALVTCWYLSTFRKDDAETQSETVATVYASLYGDEACGHDTGLSEEAAQSAREAHVEAFRNAELVGENEAARSLERNLRDEAVQVRESIRGPSRGFEREAIQKRIEASMVRSLESLVPGRDEAMAQIGQLARDFHALEPAMGHLLEAARSGKAPLDEPLKALRNEVSKLDDQVRKLLGVPKEEKLPNKFRQALIASAEPVLLEMLPDLPNIFSRGEAAVENKVISKFVKREGEQIRHAVDQARKILRKVFDSPGRVAGVLPVRDPQTEPVPALADVLSTAEQGDRLLAFESESIETVNEALEKAELKEAISVELDDGGAGSALVVQRALTPAELSRILPGAGPQQNTTPLAALLREDLDTRSGFQTLAEHRSIVANGLAAPGRGKSQQAADAYLALYGEHLDIAAARYGARPDTSYHGLLCLHALAEFSVRLPRAGRTKMLETLRLDSAEPALAQALRAIPLQEVVPANIWRRDGEPDKEFRQRHQRDVTERLGTFFSQVDVQSQVLGDVAKFNAERARIRSLLKALSTVPGARVTVINTTIENYPSAPRKENESATGTATEQTAAATRGSATAQGDKSPVAGVAGALLTLNHTEKGQRVPPPGLIYVSSEAFGSGVRSVAELDSALGLHGGNSRGSQDAPFAAGPTAGPARIRTADVGGLVSIPVAVGAGIKPGHEPGLPCIDLPDPTLAPLVSVLAGADPAEMVRTNPEWGRPIGAQRAGLLYASGTDVTRYSTLGAALAAMLATPDIVDACLTSALASAACFVRQLGPLKMGRLDGAGNLDPYKLSFDLSKIFDAVIQTMVPIWRRTDAGPKLESIVCIQRQQEVWEPMGSAERNVPIVGSARASESAVSTPTKSRTHLAGDSRT